MNTLEGPLWYAINSQPRAETKALGHLGRQGYRVYLPRYSKKIRHARKTEWVARPLFPGYLFVHLDLATEGWRSVRSTVGVSHMVCFSERPAPVPAGVVEGLKARESADGLIQVASQPPFKRGDRVVVLDGPFSHQLGLCDGITDRQRVAILLDLLGRKVRVTIDAEAVEAA